MNFLDLLLLLISLGLRRVGLFFSLTTHLAYLHQCFQMCNSHRAWVVLAWKQTKVNAGGLDAFRTLWKCERFKRILWCLNYWKDSHWLMALPSSEDCRPLKWINAINITVDCTFVSSMIFCTTVYFLKPIKDLNVTAYCELSPFIVNGSMLPSRQGSQFKQTLLPSQRMDEIMNSDHQNTSHNTALL